MAFLLPILKTMAFKKLVIGIMKVYAKSTETMVDDDLVSVIEQSLEII